MLALVLGGARSGKSRFAENWCHQLKQNSDGSRPITYIATATAIDHEMQQRIHRHQADRPKDWQLIECPLQLSDYFSDLTAGKTLTGIYLLDCLTLWLNNQLFDLEQTIGIANSAFQAELDRRIDDLIACLSQLQHKQPQCHLIMVSNEVGTGVVPMGEVSRYFVDNAGWLNQKIAQIADKVVFVAAGLPQQLKPSTQVIF